jgi:hypothetical protein
MFYPERVAAHGTANDGRFALESARPRVVVAGKFDPLHVRSLSVDNASAARCRHADGADRMADRPLPPDSISGP